MLYYFLEAIMIARVLATAGVLFFAIGAFCGIGEGNAGPLNLFGWLLLVIAFLIWRYWGIIIGHFSPGLLDGMMGGNGDHYRGIDDHYRRDRQQHYRETEERQRRGERRP
jgi:fatty acid desaturase